MIFHHMPAEGPDVRESGLLCLFQIRQQRGGGEDRRIVVGKAKSADRFHLPLAMDLLAGMMKGELPAGTSGDGFDSQRLDALGDFVRGAGWKFRHKDFRRAKPGQFIEYLTFRPAGGNALACR